MPGRPRCDNEVWHPCRAILVVDDHDGFRAFARTMLEGAGFTVAEAASGAEAAEAARTIRPCLVLLDIQLPTSTVSRWPDGWPPERAGP